MYKRLFVYIVLVTVLFARMDFNPIHSSYLAYGKFPNEDVYQWWPSWSAFRTVVSKVFCPPCAALAEHYYFVLFEVEASTFEQQDLLLKHAPYDGILSPNGFWWGQGGEDNSNEWKRVSLLAWYLYWLPYTVLWWWLYAGDLFNLRLPWWDRGLKEIRLYLPSLNSHLKSASRYA